MFNPFKIIAENIADRIPLRFNRYARDPSKLFATFLRIGPASVHTYPDDASGDANVNINWNSKRFSASVEFEFRSEWIRIMIPRGRKYFAHEVVLTELARPEKFSVFAPPREIHILGITILVSDGAKEELGCEQYRERIKSQEPTATASSPN